MSSSVPFTETSFSSSSIIVLLILSLTLFTELLPTSGASMSITGGSSVENTPALIRDHAEIPITHTQAKRTM